jgi:DNA repair exonuclease SbcCD ATPase subunit
MISRSAAMPRQERATNTGTEKLENCPGPEERYSEILNQFNSFNPAESSPITPRKGLANMKRTDKSRIVSPRSLGLSKAPGTASHRHSKKSVRSKSTAVTGSLSTDPDDSPASKDSKSTEEVNKHLARENKRLKRMLKALERHSDGSASSTHKHKSVKSEPDVMKLSEKAKAFKHQFKDERRKAMQMGKNLEAHHIEIEGLQRELAKALDTVDDLEKDQTSDRAQLLKLTNELEEWRKNDAKTPSVKRLESELRQRNDELEMTLEMLEAKVERIVLLEKELQATKRRLQEFYLMEADQNSSLEGSQSPLDLEESRKECRRLKRQNMMLKLLVEELEENRTSDEGEDIDGIFHKVAVELNGSVTEQDVSVSSPLAQDRCPTPDNCSPVGKCSSFDDPSTDASSARAEALFQKEIERFSLQESDSTPLAKSRKCPLSPKQTYIPDSDWIHPHDL